MVNITGLGDSTALLAVNTQRMLDQPACPGLLPLVVVVTLGAALARFGTGTLEQMSMSIAVPGVTGQHVAALCITWLLWS